MKGQLENVAHRYDSSPQIYSPENNFNFKQCSSWDEAFPTRSQKNSMLRHLTESHPCFITSAGLSLLSESSHIKFGGQKKQQPIYHAKIWPLHTELTYCFLNNENNLSKNAVIRSFKIWEEVGIGLSFKQVKKIKDSVLRIDFKVGGSYSYVGTDCLAIGSNNCTMNFGWDISNDLGTPLHQIGHTLGLYHEHQIPTCPIIFNKYQVFKSFSSPPCNWSNQNIERDILKKMPQGMILTSQWDSKSIMHYYFSKSMIDGPNHLKKDIPVNYQLSKKDKQYIKCLYPKEEQDEPLIENIEKSILRKIGKKKEQDFSQGDEQDSYGKTPLLYCPSKHKMNFEQLVSNQNKRCDICIKTIPKKDYRHTCKKCDFDLCVNCSKKKQYNNKQDTFKGQKQESYEKRPTLYCPNQHEMLFKQVTSSGKRCDICRHAIPKRDEMYTCKECDFDVCVNCSKTYN